MSIFVSYDRSGSSLVVRALYYDAGGLRLVYVDRTNSQGAKATEK